MTGDRPDLAGLLSDPARVTDMSASDVPALLAQIAAEQARLAAVQGALAARLVTSAAHTNQGSNGDRWLTVAEVADRTGFSADYLYRHADKLPFMRRQGRTLRFSESGLARWMARHSR